MTRPLSKGKQMSHTVMAEFHCNEGMGELLLPGLIESLSDTRAFEGCESVETYVNQDDPDRVYPVSYTHLTLPTNREV